jgi:hypothetical protein
MNSLPANCLLAALIFAVAATWAPQAEAVSKCGGEEDTCDCGKLNPCVCCDPNGNCTWYAWHMACCNWGRALEWCTDAHTWNEKVVPHGYPTGSTPMDSSIFVCEASAKCSGYGHVGWVVTAHPDGSFDSKEQSCLGPAGTFDRNRSPGFATGGFIYNPSAGP